MIRVFVSGCYDILHAGHIEFFTQARALGDHLTVSFASSEVLLRHKQRRPSLPDEHKKALIGALSMVDEVIIGNGHELGLDFKEDFLRIRPDILAVTEDDKYEAIKRELCAEVGARYVRLPKTPPRFTPVSTSQLVRWIRAPEFAPLRVDFAGGWLDVPRFSREGGYIVNCAISPTVSLTSWPYERNSGLGGSGAWALLNGESGIDSEIVMGVGWQDPAIIAETGVCVWRSGVRPELDFKRNGDWLAGRMALLWTGRPHDTPAVADNRRDFDRIVRSGQLARRAVLDSSLPGLAEGIREYYMTQLDEGMEPLPEVPSALATKYCGGGWGGYALYLFDESAKRDAFVATTDAARPIEPFTR